MTVLVFDIETIPDLKSARRLYNLSDLNDQEARMALTKIQKEKTNHEFLPLYLHKIVAISLVLFQEDKFKVWSLGDLNSSEKDLIQRFYLGVDRYTPTLVSWNGCGYDLPVLHYRSLLHGVSAAMYWEAGDNHQNLRWNNYLNRYHYRHLDLMDVLASYQSKAFAPLDHIACLLGFPGKMGMDGAKVADAYYAGELQQIRNYCETDVLNTFCVYCRFELMRGILTPEFYQKTLTNLINYLQAETSRPHLQAFAQKIIF